VHGGERIGLAVSYPEWMRPSLRRGFDTAAHANRPDNKTTWRRRYEARRRT
jgi:hypothetical protein